MTFKKRIHVAMLQNTEKKNCRNGEMNALSKSSLFFSNLPSLFLLELPIIEVEFETNFRHYTGRFLDVKDYYDVTQHSIFQFTNRMDTVGVVNLLAFQESRTIPLNFGAKMQQVNQNKIIVNNFEIIAVGFRYATPWEDRVSLKMSQIIESFKISPAHVSSGWGTYTEGPSHSGQHRICAFLTPRLFKSCLGNTSVYFDIQHLGHRF